MPLKLTDLETVNYRLVFGNGAGKGTFIIIRQPFQRSTNRFTGTEGEEIYSDLKRLHRHNRKGFDGYCARLFDRDAGIKGKLLEALKDCVNSLNRLPDIDGAYRVTCINQACAVIAEAEKE